MASGYEALVERARDLGPGRIFSEQRGPATSRYRIGQVPTFAALLNLQADAIGFTRPTWSLASPAEYRFDIADPDLRDLFGVRYVIWPADRPAPRRGSVAQVGRHVFWELPEIDYLEVVDTIAPVAADRWNIGQQTASILRSGLFGRGYVPTLAFGGREAAARPWDRTTSEERLPARSPNKRPTRRADRSPGRSRSRPGVVLFKVSYDPRWEATVDGEAVRPQMLAPALVGVPVPEGEHEVVLTYHAFPYTGPLLLIGAGSSACGSSSAAAGEGHAPTDGPTLRTFGEPPPREESRFPAGCALPEASLPILHRSVTMKVHRSVRVRQRRRITRRSSRSATPSRSSILGLIATTLASASVIHPEHGGAAVANPDRVEELIDEQTPRRSHRPHGRTAGGQGHLRLDKKGRSNPGTTAAPAPSVTAQPVLQRHGACASRLGLSRP